MSAEINIGIATLLTIFVCALVAGMLLIRRLLAREQSAQATQRRPESPSLTVKPPRQS
ncbi:hypothetical protein AB4090_01865 [Acidithiobacillus sp. IBUN Pt1247-S3]|uniref:hypothetical protein n=1 Tax=Acidithiobacillus sp. IBUN Pt1247-S3 TaxID=3166642 RepID=UPI0034E3B56D